MRTVVLGPRPPELDALIARRHALGQDTHDEVWEGEYHMSPAPQRPHANLAFQLLALADQRSAVMHEAHNEFNLGEPDNYRVPDGGLIHVDVVGTRYVPTASLVIEVLSPGDESRDKFGHYAAHGVGELLLADPDTHTIELYTLTAGSYLRVDRSDLLQSTEADLTATVRWPTAH